MKASLLLSAGAASAAVELLGAFHPGAAVIGTVTDRPGSLELPEAGLTGHRGRGFGPA